jgi:hypothetical protein
MIILYPENFGKKIMEEFDHDPLIANYLNKGSAMIAFVLGNIIYINKHIPLSVISKMIKEGDQADIIALGEKIERCKKLMEEFDAIYQNCTGPNIIHEDTEKGRRILSERKRIVWE